MAIIPQKNLFSWRQVEASSDLNRLKLVLEGMRDLSATGRYEDKADNIVYDNSGLVYCQCGKGDDLEKDYAAMAYMGFEADRLTLKYRCPAGAYGITCQNKGSCGGYGGGGSYSDRKG